MKSPLKRYAGNPIITPQDMPFECYSVFNAGVVRFRDEYLMILRTECYAKKTSFYVARSNDGINFNINRNSINYPLSELEKQGGRVHRFDMRITPMGDTFYICHATWLDPWGSCIGIAQTDDFENFTQISMSVPSNRNAALFPEKINGKYMRIERPQNIDGTGQMWISESPDLIHWGNAHPVILPYTNWSSTKNGAGTVPIKTDYGWLEIYHATCMTASTENYYLGVCLLDLEMPYKPIAAPANFILAAEEIYECVGQVPNVVFTCGACESDDDVLNIYYAGADTRICLAQTSIQELVDFCMYNN